MRDSAELELRAVSSDYVELGGIDNKKARSSPQCGSGPLGKKAVFLVVNSISYLTFIAWFGLVQWSTAVVPPPVPTADLTPCQPAADQPACCGIQGPLPAPCAYNNADCDKNCDSACVECRPHTLTPYFYCRENGTTPATTAVETAAEMTQAVATTAAPTTPSSGSSVQYYWAFAITLFILSYVGAAVGILTSVGLKALGGGSGRATESDETAVLHVLSAVSNTLISKVTDGLNFCGAVAITSAMQESLDLHPTSQFAAEPGVFWLYVGWITSVSIALIWALQQWLVDPLKRKAKALEAKQQRLQESHRAKADALDASVASDTSDTSGASEASEAEATEASSSPSVVRYLQLRATVFLRIADGLLAMTCDTLGYCCADAFNQAVFKMTWNNVKLRGGAMSGVGENVTDAWCDNILEGLVNDGACTEETLDTCFGPHCPSLAYDGFCSYQYQPDSVVNPSATRYAWRFFLLSATFALLVVTVKHVRRVQGIKSVSQRLAERDARKMRAAAAAGGGGGVSATAAACCLCLAAAPLRLLRGVWRAVVRFAAYTSVWGAGIALYTAIITTVQANDRRTLGGDTWFLSPATLLPSQYDNYLGHVLPYGLGVAGTGVAAMFVFDAALAALCRAVGRQYCAYTAAADARHARRLAAAGGGGRAKRGSTSYLDAAAARRTATASAAAAAEKAEQEEAEDEGEEEVEEGGGGAGEEDGGAAEARTQGRRGSSAAAAAAAAGRRASSAGVQLLRQATKNRGRREALLFTVSCVLCELAEILSVGFALCMGRACNMLLVTTLRLNATVGRRIAYPALCTVAALVGHVVRGRLYGDDERVVKEAPGQSVGFRSALDLAWGPRAAELARRRERRIEAKLLDSKRSWTHA
jgi:hypothetical protein